jgi:hypothetical protein
MLKVIVLPRHETGREVQFVARSRALPPSILWIFMCRGGLRESFQDYFGSQQLHRTLSMFVIVLLAMKTGREVRVHL